MEILDDFTETKDRAEDYLNAKLDLMKLELAEKGSRTVVHTITVLVVSIFLFLASIFISIGLGAWLNSIWDSTFLGYFVSAGFYVVLTCLFIVFRRHLLDRYVIKRFIHLLFSKNVAHEKESDRL